MVKWPRSRDLVYFLQIPWSEQRMARLLWRAVNGIPVAAIEACVWCFCGRRRGDGAGG